MMPDNQFSGIAVHIESFLHFVYSLFLCKSLPQEVQISFQRFLMYSKEISETIHIIPAAPGNIRLCLRLVYSSAQSI